MHSLNMSTEKSPTRTWKKKKKHYVCIDNTHQPVRKLFLSFCDIQFFETAKMFHFFSLCYLWIKWIVWHNEIYMIPYRISIWCKLLQFILLYFYFICFHQFILQIKRKQRDVHTHFAVVIPFVLCLWFFSSNFANWKQKLTKKEKKKNQHAAKWKLYVMHSNTATTSWMISFIFYFSFVFSFYSSSYFSFKQLLWPLPRIFLSTNT